MQAESEVPAPRPQRRLVLVSQDQGPRLGLGDFQTTPAMEASQDLRHPMSVGIA